MTRWFLLAALLLAAGAASGPAAAQEAHSRVTIEGGVRVVTGSVANAPAAPEALPDPALGELDADGDGGVSFDELLGAQPDDVPVEALAGFEAQFQGVDLDQDGVLTAQELEGLTPAAAGPAESEGAEPGAAEGAADGGPYQR